MSVSGCGVGRDLLSSRGCEQSGTEPADERNGQVHGRRCIIEGGFARWSAPCRPGSYAIELIIWITVSRSMVGWRTVHALR
jgi:hypothetical protein